MESSIHVTEAAAAKARQLLERSERPDDALRLKVVNGGCSGMRYELVFDGEWRDDDRESEQHGLRVRVDADSLRFVEGSTVDYSDDLNGAGFRIDNPRAQETCGCGDSFDVVDGS